MKDKLSQMAMEYKKKSKGKGKKKKDSLEEAKEKFMQKAKC